MSTRILLVDDHQIVRDGLRLLLQEQPDFEIVGEANSSHAACQSAEKLKPDIIVTDVEMPGLSGIDLARTVHAAHPHIKIIVLTAHAEAHFVNEALQAGVSGYILKVNAARELIDAIRSVLAGRVYLCPEVSTVVVREYHRQMNTPRGAGLQAPSRREREVLARIADGPSTKEIAAVLNLSVKTIETHRLHIMAKLKVNSVAELTKHAIREGLSTL